MAEPSLKHLEAIRVYELQQVMELFPRGGKVLDLGAGTGWQTKILASQGFDVTGVDLEGTLYSNDRVWPVIDYNGRTQPNGAKGLKYARFELRPSRSGRRILV